MLKQTISQKLLQKLSPQQIQLMKLLQLPTLDLEQRIKQEIEENPALDDGPEQQESDDYEQQQEDREERTEAEQDFDINDYLDDDVPQYKTANSHQGPDEDEKAVPLSQGRTFHDYLQDQLSLSSLDEREGQIASTLIGNLDDAGYLRRDLLNIVDDLAFSQNLHTEEEELERILAVIQSLDPPGVGARNLRECLLIQMKRRNDGDILLYTAEKILEDHFEAFTKKHYSKIINKLEISEEDLKDAIDEIVKLNPKPGNSIKESSKNLEQVIPDFILQEREGDLTVTLNGRNAPQLHISRQYENMLRAYSESKTKSKKDKEAIMFVKQKIDSAKWFIDAILQRQHTLISTMTAILEYQKEYFKSGDETRLKPMILKDIADIVNLDISTISRVANSKYVQTQYGIIALKYFFSESLSKDTGEEVSTREVKQILLDAVESEESKNPQTDEKLAKLLKDKGYNIARRTVAKYREQLEIPVARLRKKL